MVGEQSFGDAVGGHDLFLPSHRNVATLSGPEAVEGRSAAKRKNSCMGVCLGDVTAIAAEEGSALLWTGTDWGGVATWDTDVACQWGGTAAVSPKGAAVTAITPSIGASRGPRSRTVRWWNSRRR